MDDDHVTIVSGPQYGGELMRLVYMRDAFDSFAEAKLDVRRRVRLKLVDAVKRVNILRALVKCIEDDDVPRNRYADVVVGNVQPKYSTRKAIQNAADNAEKLRIELKQQKIKSAGRMTTIDNATDVDIERARTLAPTVAPGTKRRHVVTEEQGTSHWGTPMEIPPELLTDDET